MSQSIPPDKIQDYQKQLEEYAKSTIDGVYAVEARYDRSALAIAIGGFALFATLLRFDATTEDTATLGNLSGIMSATLFVFTISIAFILAHQVFGSLAHREMLKKVRNAIKLTSQGQVTNIDLESCASEKISSLCFKLSAITMTAGLLMSATIIAAYWYSFV